MAEMLRDLARFEDEPLSVTGIVRTERLNDLRDVEEGDVDRMVLKNSEGVLKEDRVVAEFGLEEAEGGGNGNRRPEEEVLLERSLSSVRVRKEKKEGKKTNSKLAPRFRRDAVLDKVCESVGRVLRLLRIGADEAAEFLVESGLLEAVREENGDLRPARPGETSELA
jgi:hypothetical protein